MTKGGFSKKLPVRLISWQSVNMEQIQHLLQQAFHHAQKGDFANALTLCNKAKAMDKKFYAVFNTYGMIYLMQGDPAKALKSLNTALKLEKKDPVVWQNLGNAYLKSKKYTQAQKAFEETLARQPNNYAALNNLGEVLILQDKLDNVEDYLNKAIELHPQVPQAFHNLGFYKEKKGNPQEALSDYDQALSLNPNIPITLLHKADILVSLDRHNEAIPCLEQILEFNPKASHAHQSLGVIYIETGDAAKADFHARQAIALDQNTYAYLNLANLNTITKDDPILEEMKEILNNKATTEQRKIINFALAYVMDKHGNYKDAFSYLAQANKIKRKEFTYNVKRDVQEFKEIAAYYDKKRCQDRQDCIQQPIFILGMPRSGSTLVEQILSSHKKIHGAGEIELLEESITKNLAAFPAFEPEELENLTETYSKGIAELGANTEFVSNKNLSNIKYIGLIKIAFPRAKIIHCKRNPMDNCFSIYLQNFQNGLRFAFDQEEIAQYYLAYKELMTHWKSVFQDEIYDISYEELIANPEEEIRKLLDACDLDFDPNCLTFHKTERLVKTASYTQVRNPIYKSSVERWLNYKDELKELSDLIL